MKKLTVFLLAAVVMFILPVSCSKSENDDASSLLATVPADAASVVMFNMAHTIKSLGGKTDGREATLPDELRKAIDKSDAVSADNKRLLREICSGEAGISLNSFVFFSAARSYVTGMVNDPEKFVAYVQKNSNGAEMKEEDGAKVLERIALIGNQFWICTDGTPDVAQLKYYLKLNDKQSYASADAAAMLLEADKVANYVVDINRNLASAADFATSRMAMSMLFSDASYVAGNADFKDKTFLASAAVLNSDMKPAELLLPTKKIDPAIVKSLSQGADWFCAAGISRKLADKLSDAATSILGPTAKMVSSPLKQIDGTVAVRLDSSLDNVEVKLQSTGKDFAETAALMQNFLGMTVSRGDDKTITAFRGSKDFTGQVSAEKAADLMKGAWIGFVGADLPMRGMTLGVRVVPEKKSIRLDVEVDGGVDAVIAALLD